MNQVKLLCLGLICVISLNQTTFSQVVAPYTGIDYATDYTNPSEGSPCVMTEINAAIGDADFANGAAEVPLGWSFSGTWNSGTTYFDGPGDEVLLVSLHTYTESWNVALRLSDGSTTSELPYDLTIVTSNGIGSLAVCGGVSAGPYDYERPSQLLDFADFTIPLGVGVIGIVFEPFADGAANPDPHGVLILEGTPFDPPCEADETPTSNFEFVVGGSSSSDGATGGCVINEVQFNSLAVDPDIGEITSWDWDFGDGGSSGLENPTHTYGAAGTYNVTLTVTTDAGCSATFSMIIIMTNGLALDFLINEPSCYGFSDGSITVNVFGADGELTFIITDSDGNVINEGNSNTANTLNKGWYYFDVSDGSACDGIDSIFLDEPGELDIDITVTDPLCFGFKTGWARVDSVYNTTGDYDGVSYIWNPNPAGVGGEGADSTYNMGAGDYTLTINDDNGCSKVFDFEVNQPDSLYFSEFGFEPAYCRLHEYQSGNGVVFGAASGGTPDFDYLWTNLATGETINNTTWGGRNPGNYKLTVIDANGCILERTVFLDSLNPIADFSVISDQLNGDLKGTAPVEVSFGNLSQNFANPFNPTADTTFFWNLDRPIADWQVSHDYFEILDTTYTAKGQTYTVDVCLVALNKNGCTDTACKIITIYEPIVFTHVNIFTPNGDGVNDVFSFDFRSASISEFSAVIVNRWGIVVFEMDDISDAWDGTDKSGSQCNDGTYFYTYSATTDDGTELKGQGNVSLIGSK